MRSATATLDGLEWTAEGALVARRTLTLDRPIEGTLRRLTILDGRGHARAVVDARGVAISHGGERLFFPALAPDVRAHAVEVEVEGLGRFPWPG